MKRILGRVTFMLAFFWLGTAYGVAAHSEEADSVIDPAPRAIQCSAAFELMSRAAPQWSEQADVVNARLLWTDYVNALADGNGANAQEQVANEMGFMAESLAEDPSELARLATQCVADAPQQNTSGAAG